MGPLFLPSPHTACFLPPSRFRAESAHTRTCTNRAKCDQAVDSTPQCTPTCTHAHTAKTKASVLGIHALGTIKSDRPKLVNPATTHNTTKCMQRASTACERKRGAPPYTHSLKQNFQHNTSHQAFGSPKSHDDTSLIHRLTNTSHSVHAECAPTAPALAAKSHTPINAPATKLHPMSAPKGEAPPAQRSSVAAMQKVPAVHILTVQGSLTPQRVRCIHTRLQAQFSTGSCNNTHRCNQTHYWEAAPPFTFSPQLRRANAIPPHVYPTQHSYPTRLPITQPISPSTWSQQEKQTLVAALPWTESLHHTPWVSPPHSHTASPHPPT